MRIPFLETTLLDPNSITKERTVMSMIMQSPSRHETEVDFGLLGLSTTRKKLHDEVHFCEQRIFLKL